MACAIRQPPTTRNRPPPLLCLSSPDIRSHCTTHITSHSLMPSSPDIRPDCTLRITSSTPVLSSPDIRSHCTTHITSHSLMPSSPDIRPGHTTYHLLQSCAFHLRIPVHSTLRLASSTPDPLDRPPLNSYHHFEHFHTLFCRNPGKPFYIE